MSDLDALLARSKDPGAFVERRQFTLSRDKALEKMRQFTLRHPGQYALEIVQAAVLTGARWMFVDAESHAVTLGWIGGERLTHTQLDGLFDYLFVSESDRELRHLRQIAVAINVLLQREPELLRIESGDGHDMARLDLNPDGTGTVGVPAEPLDGTYIHVRFRTPGWLEGFRSTKAPPAAQLIETECMFSPTSIFLNGAGPYGWDPYMPLKSMYLARQKTFSGDGRDGWIGRGPIDEKNQITFVIGGVRISRRQVPELGRLTQGVVRDDSLVKTADMADIVDDVNWRRMLHALRPLAEELYESDALLEDLEPIEEAVVEPEDPDDFEITFEPPPVDIGVRILGRHGLVKLGDLGELPSGSRGYWILPEDQDDLEEVLDPRRFEERVFVLEEEHAISLMAEIPNLALHRIERDDASFVVEQRAKARKMRRFRINLKESSVWLRLHYDGPPGWARDHHLPVLVSAKERTVGIYSAMVHAPGVSVIVDADAVSDAEEARRLVRIAAEAVHKHVWRMIPVDPPVPVPAVRKLCIALLAESLEVLPQPEGPPALRLPSEWDAEAERLLDVPLTHNEITARQLIAVMGTHETLDVETYAGVLEDLAPLVERLGVGHLVHPEHRDLWLVEVRWEGTHWELAETAQPGPSTAALVRLAPCFDPRLPDGFEGAESPHPILMAAQRSDVEDVPWEAGWRALGVAMAAARDTDPGPWSGSSARREDLLRLGRLALHTLTPEDSMRASDGSPMTIADVIEGRVRLAFRAGPELMEADTALVTADEAALLQTFTERPLRWRFDDAPSVWTVTPEVGEDWLATTEVAGEAGKGWLGLRFPYDATGAVFLRRGWRTTAASSLDRHVRCHGFIHARGDESSEGLAELHDAAFELLEALLDALPGLEGERRTDALRYAADFAWMALDPSNPIPEALAGRLAAQVPVPLPDGSRWGDMRLWLQTAPTVRPPFPFAVNGFSGAPVDIEKHNPRVFEQSSVDAPTALAVIHNAVQRMVPDLEVFVQTSGAAHRISAWGGSRMHVQIGLRDVLVAAALADDHRALARVLLRVARAVHTAEAKQGNARDFIPLQRAALEAAEHARG